MPQRVATATRIIVEIVAKAHQIALLFSAPMFERSLPIPNRSFQNSPHRPPAFLYPLPSCSLTPIASTHEFQTLLDTGFCASPLL